MGMINNSEHHDSLPNKRNFVFEASSDLEEALSDVINKSLRHDGLGRGFHEALRALERKRAKLCVLAESCQEPGYVSLIEALCREHNVDIISIKEGTKLGIWCGLNSKRCNDKSRILACSCVVITEYGEDSDSLAKIQAEMASRCRTEKIESSNLKII